MSFSFTKMIAVAHAWEDMFMAYPATHGVTLSYNNHVAGRVAEVRDITPTADEQAAYVARIGGDIHRRSRGTWKTKTDVQRKAHGGNIAPYARRISYEQVQADLNRLDYWVCREMYKRRFKKRAADQRPSFIGFIEHPDSNVHVHMLWRVPEESHAVIADVIDSMWKKKNSFHSTDVKELMSDKFAAYCVKDQFRAKMNHEPLFVWSMTEGSC